MPEIATESFKTISTVRTALAIILTLLVISLFFQWASITALKAEQRELLAWLVDTQQKLMKAGFDVRPINLSKGSKDEERRRRTD